MLFCLSSEKVIFSMFKEFRNMELSWLVIPRGQENKIGFSRISLARISSLAPFETVLKRRSEKIEYCPYGDHMHAQREAQIRLSRRGQVVCVCVCVCVFCEGHLGGHH